MDWIAELLEKINALDARPKIRIEVHVTGGYFPGEARDKKLEDGDLRTTASQDPAPELRRHDLVMKVGRVKLGGTFDGISKTSRTIVIG